MAKRVGRFGETRKATRREPTKGRRRAALRFESREARAREAEVRALVQDRRRAGYRARAIPASKVRQGWKRILNEVRSGTFIFVTRRGALACVMVRPAWYCQVTAGAQITITVSEAESAVLKAWEEAVGIDAAQLIRRSLFGTGVPHSPTASAIQSLLQRLHRVAERASSVFASRVNGWGWLMEPVPALAGRSPISLLADDAGEKRILDLLVRIEHGVPS